MLKVLLRRVTERRNNESFQFDLYYETVLSDPPSSLLPPYRTHH